MKIFSTDFGETFGLAICFDILFNRPMIDYVENGINNIIFSMQKIYNIINNIII
jgi:hypothetical protein